MPAKDYTLLMPSDLTTMDIHELRAHWSRAWKLKPALHLSRKLLTKSLLFKMREKNGFGLSEEQQKRLDQLVRAYKRSRDEGAKRQTKIMAGTRLVREWKGKRHTVVIQNGFYEYNGKNYTSISAVAHAVTGTRWNGWSFFGISKPIEKKSGDKS